MSKPIVALERKLWGAKRAMGRLQLRLEPVEGRDATHVASWYLEADGVEVEIDQTTALAVILDGKGKS